MFAVDETSAEAVRRAFDERGELAAVVELRQRFRGVTNITAARECVRIIAGWTLIAHPATFAEDDQ